jgi:hypothetical protein
MWNLVFPINRRTWISVALEQVLSRMFGPKRERAMGEWTKLHNEEIHNTNSTPRIFMMTKSRRIRWTGHGKDKRCRTNSVCKSQGNRVTTKSRLKSKDGIKTDFKQDVMNWTDLAQDMDHQWRAPVHVIIIFQAYT